MRKGTAPGKLAGKQASRVPERDRPMYTLPEIEQKITLARAANLSGARLLENRVRVMRVCNGIGAWWMPGEVRELIGAMFPDLVIVADIHDLRHEKGGRWWKRWIYDFEFFTNGVRMAVYRKKPEVAKQAFRLWACLILGSWTAFHYRRKGEK